VAEIFDRILDRKLVGLAGRLAIFQVILVLPVFGLNRGRATVGMASRGTSPNRQSSAPKGHLIRPPWGQGLDLGAVEVVREPLIKILGDEGTP
jgi:hypothetical protein